MSTLIDFGPHIIPQQHFGFGDTQANLIVFGPHFIPECSPPRCNYKAELLRAQKSLEESFHADLPFPNELLSYIPAQTLNEIRKYPIITAYHYLQNMPYRYIHIMCITDNNVTYIQSFLHTYYQHPRPEVFAASTANDNLSAPITSEDQHSSPDTPPPVHVTSNIRSVWLDAAASPLPASAPTPIFPTSVTPAMTAEENL